MSTTPSLRWARIAVILLSVSVTLLLLKNNLIPLHYSSNFIQSPSNYLRSGIIPFGISACIFSLVTTGAVNIVVSVCLYLLETSSSEIFKDSNLFDNISISFVLLEPILICLHSFHYICFVFWQVTLSSIISYTPLLQDELFNALPNVTTLS